jgi:hypothetical protein
MMRCSRLPDPIPSSLPRVVSYAPLLILLGMILLGMGAILGGAGLRTIATAAVIGLGMALLAGGLWQAVH